MARSDAATVEEYLNELAPEQCKVITTVRDVVLQHLPEGYEETMNWGMISYEIPLERYPKTYNGQPLSYAALAVQKRHYALYLMSVYQSPEQEARLRDAYEKSGKKLDMGKSCVRFRKLENLPLDVIGEIIAGTSPSEFIAQYEKARGWRNTRTHMINGESMSNGMTESRPQIIQAPDLRSLMMDVFAALDVQSDDIHMVVDALMEATLSGYDSHGVMRVPRYIDELRRGAIDARGEFRILKETAAAAYVDGGCALGAITATRAINLACKKAAALGIGCVSTCNSNDIGRLGSYLRKPAKSGFLTLLTVNDSGGLPTVAPFGGAGRFFSTNPIGAGIPRGGEEPIIIDMSTSMTSVGRLKMEAQGKANVPHGWLMDHEGEPVVDPARFFEDEDNVFLLPLGGMLAGHKGFALQLLVDVLAGGLGGAGVATGIDPGIEANAIFALAVDPEHFASRETFTHLVGDMVTGLRNVSPLPGFEDVRIPGERAAKERHVREASGIPLSPTTCEELRSVIADLGLVGSYSRGLF